MRPLLVLCAAATAWALRAPRLTLGARRRRGALAAMAPAPVWIGGSVVGGVLGTPLVVRATKTWYSDGTLALPRWTPPKGAFAPTWTVLYATIGVAGRRLSAGGGVPRLAVAHYFLNLCWAPLFFGLRQIRAAAALNVVLIATLAAVRPELAAAGAASLLAPYACWLSFATVLNFEIARLNPRGVGA